jgi:hypothetical protein
MSSCGKIISRKLPTCPMPSPHLDRPFTGRPPGAFGSANDRRGRRRPAGRRRSRQRPRRSADAKQRRWQLHQHVIARQRRPLSVLALVSMRGDFGEGNPWQYPMGRATQPVLEAMGVICLRADEPEEAVRAVIAALTMIYQAGHAVAVLFTQNRGRLRHQAYRHCGASRPSSNATSILPAAAYASRRRCNRPPEAGQAEGDGRDWSWRKRWGQAGGAAPVHLA